MQQEVNNEQLAALVNNIIAVTESMAGEERAFEDRFSVPEFSSPGQVLRDQESIRILEEQMDALPGSYPGLFYHTSRALSAWLARYSRDEEVTVGMFSAMQYALHDPDLMALMHGWGQLSGEERVQANMEISLSGPDDRAGMIAQERWSDATRMEIERRVRLQSLPYARTLSTLLGPDAPLWLFSPTDEEDPVGSMQPFEFSRVNWKDITSIEQQVAIEQELFELGQLDEATAKQIVLLCWSLVAMASCINTGFFVSENDLHVSSVRRSGLTLSYGIGSRTLFWFDPVSQVRVLKVLRDALFNPLVTACDMMWIAAGIARVRRIEAGHDEPKTPDYDSFSLFLSHRGRDAKGRLASSILDDDSERGVFLDCLTLPQGVVNRRFVFESLARSEAVVVIDTPHYRESKWCLKEQWLAERLADLGALRLHRMTLEDAEQHLVGLDPVERRPGLHDEPMRYPVTARMLNDIDYWARAPNLHSLREKGIAVDAIEEALAIIDAIGEESLLDGKSEKLSGALNALFDADDSRVDADNRLELLSTQLQAGVALLGLGSSARSKVDVRRGIDQLNRLLGNLQMLSLFDEEAWLRHRRGYLVMLASAVVIDLTGFSINPRMASVIRGLLPEGVVLRDNLLLLDVRHAGARRDLHQQLMLEIVSHNIGSVGLVQRAEDPVHNIAVGGRSLAVLPCVTLHPGMERLFPELEQG